MLAPKIKARTMLRAQLHTGEIVVSNSKAQLRKEVARRLHEIEYRPENFEAYFLDAACQMEPPGVCEQQTSERFALRFGDVANFVLTMGKWKAGGGQFVSEEEARRRAAICAGCPHNTTTPGCTGCYNLAGRIAEVVGNRELPELPNVNGCSVCGCSLAIKCWLPKEVLTPADFPEWCWAR